MLLDHAVRATAVLIPCGLAWWGLGRGALFALAPRNARLPQGRLALPLLLGLAVAMMLHGWLAAAGAFGARPLLGLLALGVLLAAVAVVADLRAGRARAGLRRLRRRLPLPMWTWLLLLLLLVSVALRWTESGFLAFNANDDCHGYLGFPHQLLVTGTYGLDRFSLRHATYYGGYWSLTAAPLVLGADWVGVRLLDTLLGGVAVSAALAAFVGRHGGVRAGIAAVVAWWTVCAGIVGTPINSTPVLLQSAAVLVTLDLLVPSRGWPGPTRRTVALMAGAVAGVATLCKQSSLPSLAVLGVAAWLLALRDERTSGRAWGVALGRSLRMAFDVSAGALLVIGPWVAIMIANHGTPLMPVVDSRYSADLSLLPPEFRNSPAVSSPAAWFSRFGEVSGWAVGSVVVAIVATLAVPVVLRASIGRRRWLVCTAVAWLTVPLTAMVATPHTAMRYASPVFTVGAAVCFGLAVGAIDHALRRAATTRSRPIRVLRPLSVLMLLGLVVAGLIKTYDDVIPRWDNYVAVQRALADVDRASGREPWERTITELMAGGELPAAYERLPQAVPAGNTILAVARFTHLLPRETHTCWHMNWPGSVGYRELAVPVDGETFRRDLIAAGVDYLFYDRSDHAGYFEKQWAVRINHPYSPYRWVTLLEIELLRQCDELIALPTVRTARLGPQTFVTWLQPGGADLAAPDGAN